MELVDLASGGRGHSEGGDLGGQRFQALWRWSQIVSGRGVQPVEIVELASGGRDDT